MDWPAHVGRRLTTRRGAVEPTTATEFSRACQPFDTATPGVVHANARSGQIGGAM
jgi:hypothetical protein